MSVLISWLHWEQEHFCNTEIANSNQSPPQLASSPVGRGGQNGHTRWWPTAVIWSVTTHWISVVILCYRSTLISWVVFYMRMHTWTQVV